MAGMTRLSVQHLGYNHAHTDHAGNAAVVAAALLGLHRG